MSTQPQPGWGPPPPPPKPKPDLPWYQRFWWAVALGALLLGLTLGAAGGGEPETQTRTVTQVSERPVFTAECEKLVSEFEQRQCEGIMEGYNKSLQGPATTTTAAKPKPTTPPAATIEDGTWAVPGEVEPRHLCRGRRRAVLLGAVEEPNGRAGQHPR